MAYDSRPRRQNTGRQFYYVDYPPKVPYEELPQQKEALEARLTQLLEAQADFEAFSDGRFVDYLVALFLGAGDQKQTCFFLLSRFRYTLQEKRRCRIRKRIGEPFVKEHADRVRPSLSKTASHRIGPVVT